jgi:restriction system protein
MESPDERLNSAIEEINEAVCACPPSLASQLWRMIGHELDHPPKPAAKADNRHTKSTSRADLQRVGGTGDAGIDGVISLDRLGLEKVYIQAKRWSNSVGRPDVQAFYGALAGQWATKGVVIPTSSFPPQAVEFVQSVERIVLIDGARLTALMIEHGVGVSHRVAKVPKVDGDYFVE